jgi:hypothetical protein
LQEESANSGAFYVTWPHEIIDNPIIHRELTRQSDQGPPVVDLTDAEPDLFTSVAESCTGVDGHSLANALETRVCNWLYMAQLAHAYHRALPTEELVLADFYVPEGSVYIDCWEEDIPAQALSGKLRKQELYRALKLRHIEINAADAERLDEVLGRGLLAFGIRC